MKNQREWLGEVEIKHGLFVEPGQDHATDKSLILGKYTARLKKIPTLDDPSFTLNLYRKPLVGLKAIMGMGDAVIVASSDLRRGDQIVFKEPEKRKRLLESTGGKRFKL